MVSTLIQRFIIANILTIFYSIIITIVSLLIYLKNLFIYSGNQSVLSPPASLSDPKYGVHKYLKANVSIFLFYYTLLYVFF